MSADAQRSFTLRSTTGLEATILAQGATLMRLRAPDARGRIGDIVLGFDDPRAYAGPHPYLGGIVGRFANRIAYARFDLDGVGHALVANDGPHCLHGGAIGFDRVVWEAEPIGDAAVELRHRSVAGDQGFPGTLDARVVYRLATDALHVEMRATSDAPTVVNLASHAYWNLEDGGETPVHAHRLVIAAQRYTPADASGIPSGGIEPVAGTRFDFRAERPIDGDYDHNFALDVAPPGGAAARLLAPESGRSLTLRTTLPGLQLYTGTCFDGSREFRHGVRTPRSGAVALEAQHFPNAPNEPRFPSARLDPGEVYAHRVVYELGIA
jgi:aldose 1-epimerase